MTLLIVTILILGYILIATENVTSVNKAAVAIFVAAVGWVLYICYGADFVAGRYSEVYNEFYSMVSGTPLNENGMAPLVSSIVKQFVAQNVFIPWVGKAAEVVLFLLATMTIVEILSNNGCFDFIAQLLRTRNRDRMLWTLSVVTFVFSANLDNLTTTVMMLIIMHRIIPNRRQRMIYGSAILLAANGGGALTVIGNPEGLVLWNMGAVTATNFSMSLLVPCLLAWLFPTWLLGRMLPERIDTEWITMPYRGDDTRLNVWQRLLMLFVGIGGLWFIPTFHNITKLSPFLGALCVLAVLWVVNEIFNRKLINSDEMIYRRAPRLLQYGSIQMMLFVMGMMLALGVVKETGAIDRLAVWIDSECHNVWVLGIIAGLISTVLDNFATAMSMFSLHTLNEPVLHDVLNGYSEHFVLNGAYWKVIAYCVMAGGNVLTVGSMGGLALMKMERMHVGWYFRNVGWKALVGGLLGLLILWLSNAGFQVLGSGQAIAS